VPVDLAGTPVATEFRTTSGFPADDQVGRTVGCDLDTGSSCLDDGAAVFPCAFGTTGEMSLEPVSGRVTRTGSPSGGVSGRSSTGRACCSMSRASSRLDISTGSRKPWTTGPVAVVGR
jgi:hypothetical protein